MTKNQPIENETEATHGAHLFRSLFAHAFELMDQLQRYQDCQDGEHPGYEDLILTRQHRAPLDHAWKERLDAWLRRERARRCVDPAGLRRTYGKGGEEQLGAIPEEVV